MAQQTQSRLLTAIPEIRLSIYDYVASDSNVRVIADITPGEEGSTTVVPHALSRVCRQLRDEFTHKYAKEGSSLDRQVDRNAHHRPRLHATLPLLRAVQPVRRPSNFHTHHCPHPPARYRRSLDSARQLPPTSATTAPTTTNSLAAACSSVGPT